MFNIYSSSKNCPSAGDFSTDSGARWGFEEFGTKTVSLNYTLKGFS
jgi:hypothetical protein